MYSTWPLCVWLVYLGFYKKQTAVVYTYDTGNCVSRVGEEEKANFLLLRNVCSLCAENSKMITIVFESL